MQKAGIAIDDWKLAIFDRHLRQAGYSFENSGHLTAGMLVLRVDTTNLVALSEVLRAANTEAAMTGAPQ